MHLAQVAYLRTDVPMDSNPRVRQRLAVNGLPGHRIILVHVEPDPHFVLQSGILLQRAEHFRQHFRTPARAQQDRDLTPPECRFIPGVELVA